MKIITVHLPYSDREKSRNDGTRNDSRPWEWLILRHFRLNQPSSAWKHNKPSASTKTQLSTGLSSTRCADL